MAEKQSTHRQNMELKQIAISERKIAVVEQTVSKTQEIKALGQTRGFQLALAAFGVILVALYLGHTTTANTLAGIMVALSLGFVTGRMIFGNRHRSDSREQNINN